MRKIASTRKLSYEKVGRPAKRKPRDIEDLRKTSTTSQEKIELCLTCPYKECRSYCDRLKKFREAEKTNKNTKEKTNKNTKEKPIIHTVGKAGEADER